MAFRFGGLRAEGLGFGARGVSEGFGVQGLALWVFALLERGGSVAKGSRVKKCCASWEIYDFED